MPRLFCEEGKTIGTSYPLGESTVLGRKKDCPVVVDDAKASRQHVRIHKDKGAYYVEDLQSANGTFLNEVRITKSRLAYGDKVRVGRTVFAFLADEEQSIEGQKLGPYMVVRKIGPRGIGIVYRARQEALDRDVAIKVLDRDYTSDEDFVARFINEARQAGKVYHPNVIQVYDVGSEAGMYYVAMEYVSGRPLRDSLTSGEPLPLADALRITRESASAMAAAHEKQIVHRELTPANIILTQENTAKVAELGITKESRIDRKDLQTLYCLSPEEARGMTPDDRSDIYSLGVCFFHMLSGRPPFKSDNAASLIQMHAKENLPDLGRIRPDLPEAAISLAERMCAKLPKDRIQSMKEVEDELGRIESSIRSRASSPHAAHPPIARPVAAHREAAPSTRRVAIVKKSIKLGLPLEIAITAVVSVILFFICSLGIQVVLQVMSK
jgi:serine/threonine protein kinase